MHCRLEKPLPMRIATCRFCQFRVHSSPHIWRLSARTPFQNRQHLTLDRWTQPGPEGLSEPGGAFLLAERRPGIPKNASPFTALEAVSQASSWLIFILRYKVPSLSAKNVNPSIHLPPFSRLFMKSVPFDMEQDRVALASDLRSPVHIHLQDVDGREEIWRGFPRS